MFWKRDKNWRKSEAENYAIEAELDIAEIRSMRGRNPMLEHHALCYGAHEKYKNLYDDASIRLKNMEKLGVLI